MGNVKGQTRRNRRHSFTAGEAFLLGVGIGCAVAIVAAFTPCRVFSYSFLALLLLTIGPFGGISGYSLWLLFDPVRGQRLERITGFIAFPAMVGLLVMFPDFWRNMARTTGPNMVWTFMGLGCSLAFFAVGAGLGVVHLVGHLASSRYTKPAAARQMDGVWDRELDQG